MKKVNLWLLSLAILGIHLNAYAGGVDSQGRELYRDGGIIVKYKDIAKRSRALTAELYERIGVQSVKRFGGVFKNFELLQFNQKLDVYHAVDEAMRNPSVEYAQPNYMIYALPIKEERVPRGKGEPCLIPGIPFPEGCEDSGNGGGNDGGSPFPIPGGGGEGGGDTPCLFPGIPFPPGCTDSGGGGGGGSPFPPPGGGGGNGGGGGGEGRPQILPMPSEPSAAQDPDMSKTYGIQKIQAPQAWTIQKGSKNVVVAVIDTGIDYNHPDLAFNIWRNPAAKNFNRTGIDPFGEKIAGDVVGWDFVHNDNLPFDDNMHGTHCAGVIGAVGNDGVGISGVNQRVSIMGIKFLSKEGSGDSADAIKAIDYAVSRGAKILSNSWGGKGDDGSNQALEDAIRRAESQGVLFVAAAGNDSTNNDSDPVFPATFKVNNIIAVAATNEQDGMAFFSNYGKNTVHVGAPGAGIYSTIPNKGYTKLSGTSMAAPHVAGAAALVLAQFPNASYAEIKRRLTTYGDDLPALANKTISGKRINVYKAITGSK